jgi:hypothetical protein
VSRASGSEEAIHVENGGAATQHPQTVPYYESWTLAKFLEQKTVDARAAAAVQDAVGVGGQVLGDAGRAKLVRPVAAVADPYLTAYALDSCVLRYVRTSANVTGHAEVHLALPTPSQNPKADQVHVEQSGEAYRAPKACAYYASERAEYYRLHQVFATAEHRLLHRVKDRRTHYGYHAGEGHEGLDWERESLKAAHVQVGSSARCTNYDWARIACQREEVGRAVLGGCLTGGYLSVASYGHSHLPIGPSSVNVFEIMGAFRPKMDSPLHRLLRWMYWL